MSLSSPCLTLHRALRSIFVLVVRARFSCTVSGCELSARGILIDFAPFFLPDRETDDATLPDLSPQGIAASAALPTGSWQCFEYHLGTDGTVETWLNNTTIAGLTVKPGTTNSNAGQWQRSTIKPKITAVYFGWESYGGDTNTFWYDDIVVSSSRVGC